MSQASELIAEFGHGSLDDKLTAAINEVVAAVLLNEKPGAVTLKLGFAEKGGGVIISTTVTTTPSKGKSEAFYFADEEGNLSRRDPRQPELPNVGTIDIRHSDQVGE
jgi:hypothetical protein